MCIVMYVQSRYIFESNTNPCMYVCIYRNAVIKSMFSIKGNIRVNYNNKELDTYNESPLLLI